MRTVEERVLQPGAGRLRSGDPTTDLKRYFDRVAKYVPAEVIAAYISANGIAALSRSPATLFAVIFVVCVACTPIYITRFTKTPKESWTNGLMSVAAFIVWAYATGQGLVKQLDWYDPPTASVVLVLFTLASGAVVPTVTQEPPQPTVIPTGQGQSRK